MLPTPPARLRLHPVTLIRGMVPTVATVMSPALQYSVILWSLDVPRIFINLLLEPISTMRFVPHVMLLTDPLLRLILVFQKVCVHVPMVTRVTVVLHHPVPFPRLVGTLLVALAVPLFWPVIPVIWLAFPGTLTRGTIALRVMLTRENLLSPVISESQDV